MMTLDIVILTILSFAFPLFVGFAIGNFYSKERFEQEYREGFERGYSLGKMESGAEE